MSSAASELIRLKYKYRNMILRGEMNIPLDAARKLVGPDCAYHLYFMIGHEQQSDDLGKRETKPSRRRKKS